jgi:type IV pilus assembly protein PilO
MWRVVGIVGAVLLLVASWFAVISPTLQSAAALEDETVSQEQASSQLRSRISLLKKQSEELPAQEAILAEIQQRMPPTVALPTLIRNLTTVAQQANVLVASVTPSQPAPVAQPVVVTATPVDDPEAQDAGDSGEAGEDPPSSAVAAPPMGPQVQAVSLNITACGTFAQLRNYLREIESMKRVAAVSNVSISKGSCTEGSAEDDLTASVVAHVFTLPNANPESAAVETDPTEATNGSESDE